MQYSSLILTNCRDCDNARALESLMQQSDYLDTCMQKRIQKFKSSKRGNFVPLKNLERSQSQLTGMLMNVRSDDTT